MLNILVYNRSSKSLSQTVWNAALCLPNTYSWTGRGWPMPHSLCVLWRTISHFSTACTYRAGKRWASRALSAKWRDYLKVSRLNIYYVSYWSTTIEHSTVSWISSLANHFITNMFIFHQQMLSHLKSGVIPNSSLTSKGVLVLWMDHCLMLSCLALTWHAIAAVKAGYPPTSLLHVDSIFFFAISFQDGKEVLQTAEFLMKHEELILLFHLDHTILGMLVFPTVIPCWYLIVEFDIISRSGSKLNYGS